MGGRPPALLVEMWVGVDAAEDSKESSRQRIMDGAILQSSGSHQVCRKETESPY